METIETFVTLPLSAVLGTVLFNSFRYGLHFSLTRSLILSTVIFYLFLFSVHSITLDNWNSNYSWAFAVLGMLLHNGIIAVFQIRKDIQEQQATRSESRQKDETHK